MTPHPFPHRARLLPAALAAALALSACGTKDQVVEATQAATPASGTTAGAYTLDGPGKKLTQDQAEAALLSKDDVVANGWDDMSEEAESTPSTSTGGGGARFDSLQPHDCRSWWDFRNGGEGWPGREVYVQRSFSRSAPGKPRFAVVTSRVASYSTPEAATKVLERFAEGTTVCKSFTTEDENGEYTGEVVDFPGLHYGDRSEAWSVHLSSLNLGTTYTWDTVLVQVGHNLVEVQAYHHEEIGPEDLRKLVDENVRKLEDETK